MRSAGSSSAALEKPWPTRLMRLPVRLPVAGSLPGHAGRVAVLLLVAHHAWLLGARILDGQIVDPLVALRWTAAALLATAFLGLRRLGLPLVRGRKAIVLWLLVVLLHAHAAWVPATTGAPAAGRETVATAAAPVVAGSVLALGLFLLTLLLRETRPAVALARGPLSGEAPPRLAASGFLLRLSARPPPVC
jgi:hypothetical protein